MAKFTELTQLLEKLDCDEFGTWKHDTEHTGKPGDPIHIPFPIYTDVVHDLIKITHVFVEEHPEYPLHDYRAVMKRYGIDNLQSADIDSLNDEAALALLTWVIRGERFCDGLILENLKEGRIQHLLKRLKDLDEYTKA